MSDPMTDKSLRGPGWHWRNCRSLSVSAYLHVWPWHFGAEWRDDYTGGLCSVSIGPITLGIDYDTGNSSSENPIIAAFGLSDCEAWERACKYEGVDP